MGHLVFMPLVDIEDESPDSAPTLTFFPRVGTQVNFSSGSEQTIRIDGLIDSIHRARLSYVTRKISPVETGQCSTGGGKHRHQTMKGSLFSNLMSKLWQRNPNKERPLNRMNRKMSQFVQSKTNSFHQSPRLHK